MKTFIVDWGKDSTGGRFALIQETSIENAWVVADSIGSPFEIEEFKIKLHDTGDGKIRYMEMDTPKEIYAGDTIEKSIFKLKSSASLFSKVYG